MLNGKVALVTGGAQGIGRGVALSFAQKGASVAVVDINLEKAEKVAKDINILGQRALAVKTDISNREEVDKMAGAVLDEFDKVDIVFNNAGIARDKMILKMTEEQWDAVIGVHLVGAFNCTQVFVEGMINRKDGRIINIISAAGLVGNLGSSNYAAAKSALIGMTKANARELAKYKITVNAIGPAADTPILRHVPEAAKKAFTQTVALGYMAPPQEIGDVAVFLASDEAKYVTGQVIHAEGGMFI